MADTLNRAVRRIDLASGVVSTLALTRAGGFASLDAPAGLVLEGTRLYVTDSTDDDVAVIDLAQGQISTLAGPSGVPGAADGVGVNATFYVPVGVADGQGDLYVVDNQGYSVRKIVVESAAVSTVAGNPVVSSFADGIGSAAYFSNPFGAAVDGLGDLFVSDTGNQSVRRVDPMTGTVTTVVGAPNSPGVRLGPLPAQLSLPSAVALTPNGGLLVVSENAVLIAH